MKLHTLSCPACGAELSSDSNLSIFYCQYCGHRIIVDESDKEIDAKVEIESMAHKERMTDKQREHELKKIKLEKEREEEKLAWIITPIVLLILVFMTFMEFMLL